MSGNFIPNFTLDNIRELDVCGQKAWILCMGLHSRKIFEGKVEKIKSSSGLSGIASIIGADSSNSEDYLESELIRLSMCDPQGNLLFKDNAEAFTIFMEKLPYEAGKTIIDEIADLNDLFAKPSDVESAFNDLTEDEQNEFKNWYLDHIAEKNKERAKKK